VNEQGTILLAAFSYGYAERRDRQTDRQTPDRRFNDDDDDVVVIGRI